MMPAEQILADWAAGRVKRTGAGEPIEISVMTSVGPSAALWLYRTVRALRQAATVEVGLAWACSALGICAALRDNGAGCATVIDPDQTTGFRDTGIATLRQYELWAHVRFLAERSEFALPALLHGGARFQFAFIDGDHRIDYVFTDFTYIDRMLDVGGVVVFDDFPFASVQRVVAHALGNLHYEVFPCPEGRLAALRKVRADDRGAGPWTAESPRLVWCDHSSDAGVQAKLRELDQRP